MRRVRYATVAESCPICGQGRILVVDEGDGRTLCVACNECGAMWDAPGDLHKSPVWGGHTFARLIMRCELKGHPWYRFVSNVASPPMNNIWGVTQFS
jgi:hypothetical protein